MSFIIVFFKVLFLLPSFVFYYVFDKSVYKYYKKYKLYNGWGLHLYIGDFGEGKTSNAIIQAYKECSKYPQLNLLTNVNVCNFPEHTNIIKLKTFDDILNAPENTLVVVDELGTITNSRDFVGGRDSLSKPVFQQICQCRHRHIKILGTAQYYMQVDKQLRDICATVTECSVRFKHPFSRLMICRTYDKREYEAGQSNRLYIPKCDYTTVHIQTDKYRALYDTKEIVETLLHSEYLSDEEILRNQGSIDYFNDGSKEGLKAFKKAQRRRR